MQHRTDATRPAQQAITPAGGSAQQKYALAKPTREQPQGRMLSYVSSIKQQH
jgi:hypothetical protein